MKRSMKVFQEPKVADSKYSVINFGFLTSKESGMIGVYVSDITRIIYIESGLDPERSIMKYQAKIPTWNAYKLGPIKWEITSYHSSDVHALVKEIREMSSEAIVRDEIQVSNTDLDVFKSALNHSAGIKGVQSQEQLDESITTAFKTIGCSIEFPNPTVPDCVIS